MATSPASFIARSRRPASTSISALAARRKACLAAAALRCIGGQMQTRLVIDTDELRERIKKMGIKDAEEKIRDRGHGERRLPVRRDRRDDRRRCSTGVKFGKDVIETETVVMRSVTGTVRRVRRRASPVREIPPRLDQAGQAAASGVSLSRASPRSAARRDELAIAPMPLRDEFGAAVLRFGVRIVIRVGVDVVGVRPAVLVDDELDAGDADVVGREERLPASRSAASRNP